MECIEQNQTESHDEETSLSGPRPARVRRAGIVETQSSPIGGSGLPPRGGDDDEPHFDPSVIGHSVRRRWPIACLCGVLIAPVLAAAAWFALQPKFAAVAFLRIDAVDAPLAFQTADRSGGGRGSFDLYKSTQSQLIKTPFVLNKALSDDRVKSLEIIKTNPDPSEWMKDGLTVDFPGRSEVMSITFESGDAAASLAVLDAIVDAYMNEAVLDEVNERRLRLDNLERVFSETESKVRDKRADIRKLADTLGTSDSESLSIAQQMSIQRYGQIQSELGKVEFDLMRGQGELEAFGKVLEKLEVTRTELVAALEKSKAEQPATSESGDGEKTVVATSSQPLAANASANDQELSADSEELPDGYELTDVEITAVVSADAIYQRLYGEGRRLYDEIELYKSEFGEGMIRHRRAQLQRLKSEIQRRKEEIVRIAQAEKIKQLQSGEMDVYADLTVEQRQIAIKIAEIEQQIKAQKQLMANREIGVGVLQQQTKRIENDLKELGAEAKKLGRSSVDVEMMRAEIASLDDVLARLSSEIERTRIELKTGSRVSVISESSKISDGGSKKRFLATGMAAFAGLCIPLLAFVGYDARSKLVNGSDSISRELSVPLLGSVPNERNLARQFESNRIVDGAFGNSVGSIVAILVNKAKFDDANIIMVSSAVSGEGKSTLSNSLWRGLADAKYRTLIVDFDLRRPTLHRDLGIDAGLGVSDIVGDGVSWKKCIRKHSDSKFFMTAGSCKDLNLAAAAQNTLPQLFDELRIHFDFVIVDTPPILPVVDSRVIGEHVDGCVLAVMRDRSRTPQVAAAAETLKAHGTPIMGVVVNKCSGKSSDATYYDYS
ncbi:hypothetical protein NHH03_02590 [Stieleria sp. TO1_6]|uniref:polysaccharide biosynthesis tyrosine autokinase n=1 Tax=Stieleria tagensis TaxID=2956795 RepID=UPI00209B6C1D|nr:AAA family ATPase [Stieleria tagensis]MCO8120611.1 hypothetical protein [Stieleria tagensis]